MSGSVVIAGAGPAGAVAAALLARAGREVTLIDRIDDSAFKVGETLPQVGAQLLQRLGLPAPPDDAAHCPIAGVRSIWGEQDLLQDALSLPGGGGWRLDRKRFDRRLLQAALDSGAVVLDAFAREATRHAHGFVIRTSDQRRLDAQTVVDCTGRRARLARRLGATQSGDTPLIASWAVGKRPARPLNCRHTLIETDDEGWWYGAVLPDGLPLAIFHCGPGLAGRLAHDPDQWVARLAATRVIGAQLPARYFKHSAVQRCDARSLSLDIPCGDNWFACGDAALSFNPLASQGLYNAIATAATAVKLIQLDEPARARLVYRKQIDSIRAGYRERLTTFERTSRAG